jgi:hypothetical protein
VITTEGGLDVFSKEFGHIPSSLKIFKRYGIDFAILSPRVFYFDQQIFFTLLVTDHFDDRTAWCLTLKVIQIHLSSDLNINDCGVGVERDEKYPCAY